MSVNLTRDGNVALVLIDNPPVNATSHAVRAGLVEAIAAANDDDAVGAIVIACAGKTFVAGADVKELGLPTRQPFLTDVATAIEESAKPVVAAVHGTALGGGFEIALASHARVAAPTPRSACRKSSWASSPARAARSACRGLSAWRRQSISSSSGRRGFGARGGGAGHRRPHRRGRTRRRGQGRRPRTGRASLRAARATLPCRPSTTRRWRSQVAAIARKARGQVSPGEAARMVRLAADLPLKEGLARERAKFTELVASDQAAALRHVFAAERSAAKVAGLEDIAPRTIRTVGVVGAGLMGGGIAIAFADAGYHVIVVDRDEAIDRGRPGARRGGLRPHGQIRPHRCGRQGRADGPAALPCRTRCAGRCRFRDRGGVRRPRGQARIVRVAVRHRAARRDPGDQHQLSRSGCHCLRCDQSRAFPRPAFLLARKCHAPCRSGAHRDRGAGRACDGPCDRQAAGQARRRQRRLRRLHRQPHLHRLSQADATSCWRKARCRTRSTRPSRLSDFPWAPMRSTTLPGSIFPGRAASARRADARPVRTLCRHRGPALRGRPFWSEDRKGDITPTPMAARRSIPR